MEHAPGWAVALLALAAQAKRSSEGESGSRSGSGRGTDAAAPASTSVFPTGASKSADVQAAYMRASAIIDSATRLFA